MTAERECPATVWVKGKPEVCDTPTDAYLCRPHVKRLVAMVSDSLWLEEELGMAVSRQTNFGVSGGRSPGGGSSGPLVFNPAPADARDALRQVLTRWSKVLSDETGQDRPSFPSLAQSVLFVERHQQHLGIMASSVDFLHDLETARRWCLKAVDRPPERHYLGECGMDLPDVYEGATCEAILWGSDDGDKDEAECRDCGAVWVLSQRLTLIKQQALDGMEDRIMTATQAAATIVAHEAFPREDNEVKLRDRIRKWAEPRKPLTPGGPPRPPALPKKVDLLTFGERRRPGYRLGDILSIIRDSETRRARTTSRKGTR